MNPPLLNIVLVAPEIPHNTGAIGRLCVTLDAHLHLIRPLGFSLDAAHVRRTGLDYWPHVQLTVHDNWDAFHDAAAPPRLFFASTKGQRTIYACRFEQGDFVVFGNETRGLPADFYVRYADDLATIPMPGRHARSLNLSTAAAVVMYEAYRQISA